MGSVSKGNRNSTGTSTSGENLASVPALQGKFFDRDPVAAARAVLGKVLVRDDRTGVRAARIVEVEAYLGTDDPAAHAAAGRTARNAVIFGPPGRAYVYFIYGMHFCLNISCEPEGEAGCVLVRALEPVAGFELMAKSRRLGFSGEFTTTRLRQLTSGPGRLCAAFEITRQRDNDKNLCSSESDLRVIDDGFPPGPIAVTPRIGITKAAEHPLRFCLQGNAFLSGRTMLA